MTNRDASAELVVGYAAHVPPTPVGLLARSDFRRRILLRNDVDLVLSVDDMVWPRCSGGCLDEVPSIRWRGPNAFLWDSLIELQEFLAQSTPGSADPWVMAVSWSKVNRTLERYEMPQIETATPSKVEPAWTHFGYDVADPWFVSGLTNCGIVGSSIQNWDRYANNANAYNLLRDAVVASEFAAICDGLIPEHAPFFVYGLWQLSGTPPEPST